MLLEEMVANVNVLGALGTRQIERLLDSALVVLKESDSLSTRLLGNLTLTLPLGAPAPPWVCTYH